MSKVTDERLDYVLKELGVEHRFEPETPYDDENIDKFELLPNGTIVDELHNLRSANATLKSEVTQLWVRFNRLLDHLGLEDVTIPPKTLIRKKSKNTPNKLKALDSK